MTKRKINSPFKPAAPKVHDPNEERMEGIKKVFENAANIVSTKPVVLLIAITVEPNGDFNVLQSNTINPFQNAGALEAAKLQILKGIFAPPAAPAPPAMPMPSVVK